MGPQRTSAEDGNTPAAVGFGEWSQFSWKRMFTLPSMDGHRMDKKLPPHQMNALLGRNAAYPFDAKLKKGDTCYDVNEKFFSCLNKDKHDTWDIHERLAACNSEKIILMKCQTKVRKAQKALG